MTVPVDPYDFVNGTIADGDQVDLRFKKLYDALNPAVVGLDEDNVQPGTFLALVAGGTNRKLAFGHVTLTLAASADTNTVTVTHGLGVLPLAIVPAASVGPGGHVVAVSFSNTTVAQFDLKGRVVDGVGPTGPVDCFWLAIA